MPSPQTIDYAPPRRRPGWLSGRSVVIAITLLAAAGAGWVVIPRVMQRSALLRAQGAILENRATLPAGTLVSDLTWIGSRPGMMMIGARSTDLESFVDWSLGQVWWRCAFYGGRAATPGGDRIVLVQVEPAIYGSGRPPEITVTVYVFEPGGWTRSPALLHQSTTGPVALPVPPDSGWRLAVLSGSADQQNTARFLIELETGYAQTPDTRRLTVVGHLQADDTVRFDWPTEPRPVE